MFVVCNGWYWFIWCSGRVSLNWLGVGWMSSGFCCVVCVVWLWIVGCVLLVLWMSCRGSGLRWFVF